MSPATNLAFRNFLEAFRSWRQAHCEDRLYEAHWHGKRTDVELEKLLQALIDEKATY